MVQKGWGYERIITNSNKYCGKILHFYLGKNFSMHYHMLKDETWYVSLGKLIFKWIDTDTAEVYEKTLNEGDVIHIKPGQPHQLTSLTEAEIFEVSTQHFDNDSYRVWKGDSQDENII
jgi:mannose-6-phosphate isomerase-like protein (cupin superfamily)